MPKVWRSKALPANLMLDLKGSNVRYGRCLSVLRIELSKLRPSDMKLADIETALSSDSATRMTPRLGYAIFAV